MTYFEDALKPLAPRGRATNLKRLEYAPVVRPTIGDCQIPLLSKQSVVFYDTETFPNYFRCGFKHRVTGQYFSFEISDWLKESPEKLSWIMWAFCCVGFNSYDYDWPLVQAAVCGADNKALKALSDEMILQGERFRGVRCQYNQIDLINVAPLQASLKQYAARLHTKRIQELPRDPHTPIEVFERQTIDEYNNNDLDCTEDVYNELLPAILLREKLSPKYGQDMRSMSDAGMAEVILETELKRRTGKRFKAPEFNPDFTFQLQRPSFLKFQTELFNGIANRIEGETFRLDGFGYVVIPKWLDGLEFNFGPNKYRMGGGGLHTCETRLSKIASDEWSIIDFDVASYYPRIIMECGLYPAHIGEAFKGVYKDDIVAVRLLAKEQGDMPTADGFKIVSNATFGKSKNRYSIVSSPEMGTFITIGGQLILLHQIEFVAAHDIHPITANTDGVVYLCPKARENELRAILAEWSAITGFPLEETPYKSYHARDVNNFIAVKEKGKPDARFIDEQLGCKTKGAYCERGSALNSVLSHNPEHLVSQDAVLQFLTQKTPINQTVTNCKDIRRFVTVRNVKGGSHKNGIYLGKTVRWYYAKGETGAIHYVTNGNKVPLTDGAKPLMELGEFPNDINYDWYVNKAEEILRDIGVYGKAPQQQKLWS